MSRSPTSPPGSPPDHPTRRRIGILGGSFDPIHNGHLHVARAALDQLELAEVRFLPAPSPPHKRDQQQTPVEIRAELVGLAIADEPRFLLDDAEIRRGGVSYTYDTLVRMAGESPGDELCFLIGGDSLRDLPKWYRAKDLVAEFTLVTVPRPEESGSPDSTSSITEFDAATLKSLTAAFSPSSVSRLRENVLRVTPLPVSSTELRARCAAGADVDALSADIPEAVAREIVARGLYRDPGSILSGGLPSE